jgi:hypothetical protein
MKRISYLAVVMLVAAASLVATQVQATPMANGAVITTRIFNDCPVSVLNVTNSYPGSIVFNECLLICPSGFANLHNWTFSADGGLTQMVLNNQDNFRFGANVVLNGNTTNGGEAGLRLSPWWSQQVDGRFNIRIYDGEIACFGGVLPFYSFTANYGIHYVAGEPIYLEITYSAGEDGSNPNLPAKIQYKCIWQGITYLSPVLPFTNCNYSEAVHRCYGIMDDARAGGYSQNRVQDVTQGCMTASFFDIFWEVQDPLPLPAENTSWGHVKATYR